MNAPEILPYEEKLVENITTAIRGQKEQLESINTNLGSKFTIEMYKMDVERVQYMVKKYLRTRVLKIEQQLDAILSNIEMTDCLSFKEKKFAADLHQLNKTYFQETIHRRVGESVRDDLFSSEKADDLFKHCQPNFDSFVTVRALREVDVVIAPGEGKEQAYGKGEIFFVRYKCIREHLIAKNVELL